MIKFLDKVKLYPGDFYIVKGKRYDTLEEAAKASSISKENLHLCFIEIVNSARYNLSSKSSMPKVKDALDIFGKFAEKRIIALYPDRTEVAYEEIRINFFDDPDLSMHLMFDYGILYGYKDLDYETVFGNKQKVRSRLSNNTFITYGFKDYHSFEDLLNAQCEHDEYLIPSTYDEDDFPIYCPATSLYKI